MLDIRLPLIIGVVIVVLAYLRIMNRYDDERKNKQKKGGKRNAQ